VYRVLVGCSLETVATSERIHECFTYVSPQAGDVSLDRFGPAVPYSDGQKRYLEVAGYLSDATLVLRYGFKAIHGPLSF
jgi:hypothetical protein